MNTFQLFQLKRIDLLYHIQALMSYAESKRFEVAIDAGLIVKLSLSHVFAKALAVHVLVTRLNRRLDMQVIEQMRMLLGTKYTREFCEHYNFPFPKQIFLGF